MACGAATEAVTLHDACEALTLGLASDVDLGAGLEDVGSQFLAEFVFASIGGTDFHNVTAGGYPSLLKMSL